MCIIHLYECRTVVPSFQIFRSKRKIIFSELKRFQFDAWKMLISRCGNSERALWTELEVFKELTKITTTFPSCMGQSSKEHKELHRYLLSDTFIMIINTLM